MRRFIPAPIVALLLAGACMPKPAAPAAAATVDTAMVKSGLLGKLWKFVVFGVLAVVAGVRRLFTGKRAPETAS